MNILFLTLPILMSGAPASVADSSGFLGPDVTWQLATVDGAEPGTSATLTFSEGSTVNGKVSCNTYTGPIDGTADTFVIGPLAVTRKACVDAQAESDFTGKLEMMTSGSATADELILSDGVGTQMVFKPASE